MNSGNCFVKNYFNQVTRVISHEENLHFRNTTTG